ncbi:MAG TPA: HAD family hydrolase [Myxococcota bacterium]|nr:HAD family hydrolase [Myxococcota bacterium]
MSTAARREGSPPDPEERPPRAVTFDCWHTLIFEASWETAHGLRVAALEAAALSVGRPLEPGRAGRAFDAAWGRHMDLWAKGVATGAREVAHWALEELDLRPQGPAFEPLLEAFEEASHSSRVLMIEGALETLTRLEEAGIGSALICDTGLTPGRVVRKLLDGHGLLAPLAETIFSDEWSLPKPHPRVFEAALEALGVEARDAVHVGDLRRTDVAGARGVGMRTIRLKASHDDTTAYPEADHVAGSHAEVLDLLGLASSP